MATRFGAVSPAQAYATKIRWVLGCFVVIIITLVGTIFTLINQPGDNPEQAQASAPTAEQTGPTVDIIVSTARIEEGSMIGDGALTTQPMHPDKIPPGAMLVSEKGDIVNKYAANLIRPNSPILREDISATPPASLLNIPPGFRAVTINVDKRSGVEGWAKPGSRVDVLWTYRDRDGSTRVATIIRFTKILSVEGAVVGGDAGARAATGGNTTVTLLVTEKDAMKVELARTLGSLSLSLVGDAVADSSGSQTPEVVTVESILGNGPSVEVEDDPISGKMYAKDPKTGKMVLYVLKGGRWVLDTSDQKKE